MQMAEYVYVYVHVYVYVYLHVYVIMYANLYDNCDHKFDRNCGLSVQGTIDYGLWTTIQITDYGLRLITHC